MDGRDIQNGQDTSYLGTGKVARVTANYASSWIVGNTEVRDRVASLNYSTDGLPVTQEQSLKFLRPTAAESHTARVCFLSPASFVQLCGPVQNDGHGRGLCLLDLVVDKKSLPVPAHVVNEAVSK